MLENIVWWQYLIWFGAGILMVRLWFFTLDNEGIVKGSFSSVCRSAPFKAAVCISLCVLFGPFSFVLFCIFWIVLANR